MKLLIAVLVIAAAVPGIANAKQRSMARNEYRIACTKLGCVPVPPGCGQTWGRKNGGTPTGYDVIVCPR